MNGRLQCMGVGEKKQEYKEKIETERKKERLRYIGEREREYGGIR